MTGISPELETILQDIVDDVVKSLGCVGAMVASMEPDNTLPLRTYSLALDPDRAQALRDRLEPALLGAGAVVQLNDPKFKDNLSVQAVKAAQEESAQFLISDRLYDLFRPAVDKKLSDWVQKETGIRQIIAVPFLLDEEVVGNLFAAASTEFTARDIAFLTAFSHQAATAIQSQRRLAETQLLESIILELQASLTDENRAFKVITDAVVDNLGYLAAFVAPRIGSTLPVRAYSVNAQVVTPAFIETWQRRLGFEMVGEKAVAYLDRADYAEQLSVRALKTGQTQISDSLYDLVRPVLPRRPVETVQKLLGIKQVIAIPFFLEEEAIGNLYVVSQRPQFSTREQALLRAFGQQAAINIRNAQLYRQSEERREVAQIFAKMAFSSTAYVHALRNHIGAFRIYFQMIQPHLGNEKLQKFGIPVLDRLNKSADILDNLHEPWREEADTPTDVNACLSWAIQRVIPDQDELEAREGITVHVSLAEDLPPVRASADTITEAFKILIKNGLEAVREKEGRGQTAANLWVDSRSSDDGMVEVIIQDDGIGIKPEDLDKIFELRWSTKEAGMGFGLFWTRDYIRGQGGDLRVESTWQEGTTFCLSLPRFEA